MRLERIAAGAFVALASVGIIGLSTGDTSASFTGMTSNPNQSWITETVLPPASQAAAASAPAGTVNLSWTSSPTAPNGHTRTYLVLRNGVQIGTTAGLVYSDTPATDGSYTYTIQTKLAQGTGFFTSASSASQNGISDRVAPVMSILCNGAACSSTTWYGTLNVTVSGTDAGSGMAAGTITRSVDGGATVNAAGASATFAVTGDSATHSVAYSGKDTAGNGSATTTFTPLQVDGTAPTTPTGLNGITGFSAGSIVVWWTASTDALSGLASYTIHRTNAVAACPAVGAGSYPNTQVLTAAGAQITGLVTGSKYCYYVTATDNAGNVSANSLGSALITAR
jgi:hypothetical protein